MRTEVLGVRFSTAIFIVVAVGAVALIAGGVYHHYTGKPSGELADRTRSASISTEAGEATGSLVIHDAPQAVPDLSFVDGDGREMSLADFHGRTILLNIWATWCVPCREEMPALDRLQAKLGGPGFEVVPLSIDRDGLPKVKGFYDELGLEAMGIYLDDTGKAGFVATADLKRKGGRSEANYAARIANCSARDGFGLKAYLACRLRIM